MVGTRPLIMGILNVTPDSFSDGGRFQDVAAAVAQAERLAKDGADVVDIGAESTRPGHAPLGADEEIARLAPVLAPVVARLDVPVSIDTSKSAVARYALECGASIVNDVWGLQRDPAMADTVATHQAGVVLMHNRTRIDPAIDILGDMKQFFDRSLELADRAGIARGRIMLDPGIGFGKSKAQNLKAVLALEQLKTYGLPLLIGMSRKSLFGALFNAAVDARLVPTLAAHLVAATHGAGIFRVHDVAEHATAFKVLEAIERA